MNQAATLSRIGSKVKVDLNRVIDSIPASLIQRLKNDPRVKVVDFKMTDGDGLGVVLELSYGSTSWFFDNEISRSAASWGNAGESLMIGGNDALGGNQRYYNGFIADPRVYSGSLSDKEVLWLYKNPGEAQQATKFSGGTGSSNHRGSYFSRTLASLRAPDGVN